MGAPFDTLKLARRFEAAGFEAKQAADMAEAFAEATSEQLATKSDLAVAVAEIKSSLRLLQWQVAVVWIVGAPSLWLLMRIAAKVGALG